MFNISAVKTNTNIWFQ